VAKSPADGIFGKDTECRQRSGRAFWTLPA
jgi:hypothetical protein